MAADVHAIAHLRSCDYICQRDHARCVQLCQQVRAGLPLHMRKRRAALLAVKEGLGLCILQYITQAHCCLLMLQKQC